MDDTTGEIQVQLASDHQDSALSLGHVTRVVGTSGRADFRGRGLELRTDGHGVIRAQSGLLLTTYGRIHGRSHVTDVSETLGLLKGAQAQHRMFAQLAIDHKADERGLDESVQAQLKQQNEEVAGSGALAELSAPHLLASSPAGVALASEQNMQVVARDVALTSGQDVSWSVGQRLWATAGRGVSLFTQSLGIKAFAARGKVQVQAQSDELEVFADQVAKFISAKKSIQIAAKDEVLITAKGSYIKVNSAGIEQGTPATHIVYAATKSMMGPKRLDANLPEFKKLGDYHIKFKFFDSSNKPYKDKPYFMMSSDGAATTGKTNNTGETEQRKSVLPENYAVHVDLNEVQFDDSPQSREVVLHHFFHETNLYGE
jgi:type VI secretion system secreted protein VgrG